MNPAPSLRRVIPAWLRQCLLLLYCLALSGTGHAQLDLNRAEITRLDNGLTLIVLEEPSFPVVSVQMLYRVGARNEVTGATGLAHFFEHMAFRGSRHFPGTGLVSSIYAVGGEWHGYTWLDQTTYFATAPKQHLDLLLRIEADRMHQLEIRPGDVQAETGAVLAEMHGYENSPTSVLLDNAMYLTFLAHPYRNNTIGWESDVRSIDHALLVDFYQRHYHPGNAVLAVAGDVSGDEVKRLVQHYFAAIAGPPATPPPHTLEPEQRGERRIRIHGQTHRKHFLMAWRAPAASHPDYAAFLLLQELLAGGSGVSFLQNDWGSPVRPGAILHGVTDDLASWFPPAAQNYVFTLGGSVDARTDEHRVETAVMAGLDRLRRQLSAATQPRGAPGDAAETPALHAARSRVQRELLFDVQTTEDAAHQLAFFAGLDALPQLQGLPQAVQRVTPADLLAVLDRYLGPQQRNIAWYVPQPAAAGSSESDPGGSAQPESQPVTAAVHGSAAADASAAINTNPAVPPATSAHASAQHQPAASSAHTAQPPEARMLQLSNGLPVLFYYSPLSPGLRFRVVTPSARFAAAGRSEPQASVSQNQPLWGLTSLDYQLLPHELADAIADASRIIAAASADAKGHPATAAPVSSADPAALMQATVRDALGLVPATTPGPVSPLVLVVSGDLPAATVLHELETGFADTEPAAWQRPAPLAARPALQVEVRAAVPMAQEQLAYVVAAPGPGSAAADTWRMALYILSHGYEGRLGKAAISQRGLIYYIDSQYHGDGRNGWISLNMGVDPVNMPAMQALLAEQLKQLRRTPPTQMELDEARQYLLGRFDSAALSNTELNDQLVHQWLWYGAPLSREEYRQQLAKVKLKQLRSVLDDFTSGSVIAVRNPPQERKTTP